MSSKNFRKNGTSPPEGKLVPRHTLSPGQDGYRTPTIEDYESSGAEGAKDGIEEERSVERRDPQNIFELSPIDRPADTNTQQLQLASRWKWRERIRHFTWTWFTMTMATGGVANVLYSVPFRFPGLEAIGIIFFLLNLVLFLTNIVMISLRFHWYPETFMASFLHPTESLFVPAAVVSFGTVLINISQYGVPNSGPWLNDAVIVLFWIDVGLAVAASSGIYLLMWSTQTFTIARMTPIWIFPAYPLLIIGPHAGILSSVLYMDQRKALDIIAGGATIQGIGFMVSVMIYSAFIYRLMTQKLPKESLRPAMFVSVGPSGFTVAGIVNMAANADRAFPPTFMGDGRLAAMIVKVVANWIGIWIWGLCLWFFLVSVGAHWSCIGHGKMAFGMTWYSFVFPNTALITATFAIGKAFGSHAIQVIGCVMTVALIIVWIMVSGMMIRAIKRKDLLWPQKGEDRNEGGFIAPTNSRSNIFSHDGDIANAL